jgi:curli biogenesis system outer membrane secretion channel CsgG
MEKRTLRANAAFAGATLLACASAFAQPTFGNASPNAGSATSQKANAAADQVTYKEVEYANKARQGPVLVVIPGEIKSSNAGFMQKFGPNNIADFGELELSQANFQVLERSNLGPLLNEISLAYNLGDPAAARKSMSIGKLKTAKYVVKFDILKAEPIAENKQGFDGKAAGSMISSFGGGLFGGGIGSLVAGSAVGTVKTDEQSAVWLVGMRYKIMDANTTEQVAQGYKELKMEVGANATSVMGVSQQAKGGVGMDTMIQRLVQTTVWDIDKNYK